MTANQWYCMECKREILPMDAGEMRAHLRHTHGMIVAEVHTTSAAFICGDSPAIRYEMIVDGPPAVLPIRLALIHCEETMPDVAINEIVESQR